jgi:putative ABC transport system substrate-binding protein
MRRREFITLLGGAAAAWPLAANAQQGGRMRRVAILMPYAEGNRDYEPRVRVLRDELARLGWTGGVNVQFDERWTTDNLDRVRAEAANLLEAKPDAIVSVGGRVIPILMKLTRTVPIIVPGGTDPVETGWIASLSRPGGNVTGFAGMELSVVGKSLEMLKQIVPGISRVSVVQNPDNPNASFFARAVQDVAGKLAVQLTITHIRGLAEIERTVESLAGQRDAGFVFAPDVTVNALRDEVVALLARHRVPAIFAERAFVMHGGLASYGSDRIDIFRRAASYVDRVLRSEKAGDLPYQQPTKYEFLINYKTAKALGLDIPATVLARADELID